MHVSHNIHPHRITKTASGSNEYQVGGLELYPILFTQYDSKLSKQSASAKLKGMSSSVSVAGTPTTPTAATPTTPTAIDFDMRASSPDSDDDYNNTCLNSVSDISLQRMESYESKSMALGNMQQNLGSSGNNPSGDGSSNSKTAAGEITENKVVDTVQNKFYTTCNSNDCKKKVCVGTFGTIYIIFGIAILSSFISYIHNEYNEKCLNLNIDFAKLDESRANYSITLDEWLINNPEMIFYNQYCRHKVVNIFDDFPCNCRILALISGAPNAYWFNQNDLESILLRFDNLEGMAVDFSTNDVFFESRLSDTFYLSQKMLKNHNHHLTTLIFAGLDFKYIKGLEQVKNLAILSIGVSFETIEFPFKSIGTLSNLKVLNIHQVPSANNTYIDSSICNLKQLVYFNLDFMQHLSQIPFSCISQFDDLFYFSMTHMFLIEYIDPIFWNIDSIESIFLDFSLSLKQSNFDFDTFNGFSSKLEKVSIQSSSDVCQSYTNDYQNIIIDGKEYSGFGYLYDNLTQINNNNIQLVPYISNNSDINTYTFDFNSTWYNFSFVSESDSSGLLRFIQAFNPCLAPCSSSIAVYECPTRGHGDGSCNEKCNNADCGFDGGDCNQLCNLYNYTAISAQNTTCTLDTWQMDGICNIACNNSLCNYDFQDCVYTPTTNDTCNNLSYDIENITNITCYSDWTDDLWCDSHCEQLLCESSSSGCGSSDTPCGGDTSCNTAHSAIMNLLASLYEPYELITPNEVCENFDLLALVTETNIDNLNCSQAFDIADLNSNGYIGFWEAIVYTAEFLGLYGTVHWQEKIEQIDCSSCLDNTSLYWW